MQDLIVSTLLYVLVVLIVMEHYQKQTVPTAVTKSVLTMSSVPEQGTEKRKEKAPKTIVKPERLDSLTIRQLRVKAKESKIKYYSRMSRNQLIDIIGNLECHHQKQSA